LFFVFLLFLWDPPIPFLRSFGAQPSSLRVFFTWWVEWSYGQAVYIWEQETVAGENLPPPGLELGTPTPKAYMASSLNRWATLAGWFLFCCLLQ
jgi:hypothetical protein